MRNTIVIILLLVSALRAEESRFICTAPDGREVWMDRFQGYGKAVIVVWAIDWQAYPNHKERLALTDKPINFGIFCKN